MKHLQRTRLFLGLGLGCCMLLTGCASKDKALPEFAGKPYPAQAAQDVVLDVQAFRHPTQLEFTNTTARSFGPCTMWLNGRYQREMSGIAVGQTITLELKEFRDEFGESFRASGFWAADDPELLVLTQIEVTDDAGKPQLLGLVTIRAEE